jgi:hypothetical protein
MSTVLHPVGPNPARVYWVRRILLLVALVLAVAAVAAIVWLVALRADSSGARPGGQPKPGPPSSAAAGRTAGSPVDCRAADLRLALAATAAQYPAGVNPVLTASVTNAGAAPCTVDVGDVSREVVIGSGKDRIWSTKDCAGAAASRQLLLGVGARNSVDISWSRSRSAEGCPTGLPAPRAGTYQAAVTLLGVTAAPAVFSLQ